MIIDVAAEVNVKKSINSRVASCPLFIFKSLPPWCYPFLSLCHPSIYIPIVLSCLNFKFFKISIVCFPSQILDILASHFPFTHNLAEIWLIPFSQHIARSSGHFADFSNIVCHFSTLPKWNAFLPCLLWYHFLRAFSTSFLLLWPVPWIWMFPKDLFLDLFLFYLPSLRNIFVHEPTTWVHITTWLRHKHLQTQHIQSLASPSSTHPFWLPQALCS